MSTLFKNGEAGGINSARSTLAAGVAIGATSMSVAAGHGDRFPVVAAPDVAYVTVENGTYYEIVKITARTAGADSMTIVKAQETTTDRAWLTGDIVSMRITAAQAELGANAQAVAATALAGHVAAADPHPNYTTAAELAAYAQPVDATLNALAALNAAAGLVEQTGADTFTKRAIGSGASEIPTNSLIVVVPTGAVCFFDLDAAPTGWLKADGAGILRASYAALDAAKYCGDGNNATATAWYRATDAAGTTRSTTGAYLILRDLRGDFLRALDTARGHDPDYATRTLGSYQESTLISDQGNNNSSLSITNPDSQASYSQGVGGTTITGSTTANMNGVRPENVALLACIKY